MLIERFFQKGSDFLGCEVPIVCGAMSWISENRLVSAIANAGGYALLAAGNMPLDALEKEIAATRANTAKPFGVNLITIAPAYADHLALVCDMQVDQVTFAGTIPRDTEIEKAKLAGCKTVAFAPTLALARRLVSMGVDALVLEGSEAGGHVGPISLVVLLQQVLFEMEAVPVFVAGGIGSGRMFAHLLLMGAAGIQMGTRFVVAEESIAHPVFKEAYCRAKSRDAVVTPQFDQRLPVIPVRALKNQGTGEFMGLQRRLLGEMDRSGLQRLEAQIKLEEFWSGGLKNAVLDGDIKAGSLMAGQSVGMANRTQPAREILNEMVADAENEFQRIKALFT